MSNTSVWMGQKGRVFRRILFEVMIPAVCGIVWGALALRQGKSLFESFSTGFAAFFFIFFLQGQVLRVNKNVRDEMNADEVRESFVSIHEGLKELKGWKDAELAEQEKFDREERRLPEEFMEKGGVDIEAYDGDVLSALPFFEEADRTFRRGALYPAMLSAAVGFEHAIREVAVRYLSMKRSRPPGLILHELEKKYGRTDVVLTAQTLLNVRNGLIHGDNHDIETPAFEAVQIIWAFMKSVSDIQEIVAGWPALYFDEAVRAHNERRGDK